VSGLALPPAQPPAEDVAAVIDRLRSSRDQLNEARRQEAVLDQALADHRGQSAASLDYFRVERRVARNRTMLWTRQVRELEKRARALGLKP
jgi:hypothetical protein